VYVSHTSSDFWGEDHLGDQVIAPGEQLTIAGIRHGTYDLRAETWGNVELVERYGVTIDSDMNWTLYDNGSAETTADTVATTTNAPAAAITAGEFEPTGPRKRETAQPVDASVF
jgi:hypothetical protein